MSVTNIETIEKYLNSTDICDCQNKTLREKAEDIVRGSLTQKESALKLFYFIRDEIVFGMNHPCTKASHTLKKKIGFCWTKTNLQIALLRAIKIPARCHYVALSKEQVKSMTPSFLYNRMPATIAHPWCECYLDNKWISCETLMDKSSHEACLKLGFYTKEQVPTTDWDGENDLILFKQWIVKDIGIFTNVTDFITEAKESDVSIPFSNRIFGWIIYLLMNRSLNKMRKS